MELANKYFVSTDGTQWEDVTTKWNGVKILAINGFNEKGEAINIYNEQWVNSQTEDFMVTTQVTENNVTRDVVIRKNVDLTVTFIVSRRYASSVIDEQSVYDSVVSYMCDNGYFYIKSAYTNKSAKVSCLKGFKPTTQKLHRGTASYILTTVTLHTLDVPTSTSVPSYSVVQNPTGNPKQLGFYEKNGTDSEYRLTWDNTVVSGKTYYTST